MDSSHPREHRTPDAGHLSPLSWAGVELVADASDGLDVAGAFRVRLDLGAEAAHVDGDCAAIASKGPVPDLVEGVLAAEDLTGVTGEEL